MVHDPVEGRRCYFVGRVVALGSCRMIDYTTWMLTLAAVEAASARPRHSSRWREGRHHPLLDGWPAPRRVAVGREATRPAADPLQLPSRWRGGQSTDRCPPVRTQTTSATVGRHPATTQDPHTMRWLPRSTTPSQTDGNPPFSILPLLPWSPQCTAPGQLPRAPRRTSQQTG